nr:EFR1 family ferrodoxin [uncultured Methanolobus sp.]
MTEIPQTQKVKIIFFTGTGGTALAAGEFEQEFIRHEIPVVRREIKAGNFPSVDDEELLILLFPVHAGNAPEIVYEWIESLTVQEPVSTVVISVSAGGNRKPNIACRLSTIERLERKNCHVSYEEMLVMPSNWMKKTPDGIAIRLLDILPLKVKVIVRDLLSGVEKRTDPPLSDRILSRIGELEKKGAKIFGKRIKVRDNCNGCGWCERNCPASNITMDDGKPVFNDSCLLCLKCFYGCPTKALEPGKFRFFIIKEGYDLNVLKKRMEDVTPEPIETLITGYLWNGVLEYLLEDNK